jgi:hypothetical protein
MQVNTLPRYDDSVNTTGCCPRFDPDGWDRQALHFKDKPFVRATTKSVAHIPVNMGKVFARVHARIRDADAYDPDDFIVLSRDLSAWRAEHLFAVTKPVDGEETVALTGDFETRVFEGPYRDAKHWYNQMQAVSKRHGIETGDVYFFYTTCPKCAKAYGKNHVVGVARTG